MRVDGLYGIDKAGFPQHEGASLANRLLDQHPYESVFNETLEIDLRDAPASLIISAFFWGFLNTVQQRRPELLDKARGARWLLRFPFQEGNVQRWMTEFWTNTQASRDRQRLHVLNHFSRADGDEDDVEKEELYERLRDVQEAAAPRPTCCESAQKYPTVFFAVSEDASTGCWKTPTIRSDSIDFRLRPEAEFCVYCGAALPQMRLKNPLPTPLCTVKDGGYYCATCQDRLNGCVCLQPSAAFEPVPV